MARTPEQMRAYKHEYYLRNREKIREQQRVHRQTLDPERLRAYNAEYYAANRETQLAKQRARGRRYYAENRERILARQREYYSGHRDEVLARKAPGRSRQNRESYVRNRDKRLAYSLHADHGLRPDQWAALWDAQDGRCYLCGEPMIQGGARGAHIDHDHSCCPEKRSCPVCRRGLACADCNLSIGIAGDDPARLRRMADALEAAQVLVNQRKAEAGERLTLF